MEIINTMDLNLGSAKIWFECPMEFLDFIKTPIGEEALHRLGIEKIEVEND